MKGYIITRPDKASVTTIYIALLWQWQVFYNHTLPSHATPIQPFVDMWCAVQAHPLEVRFPRLERKSEDVVAGFHAPILVITFKFRFQFRSRIEPHAPTHLLRLNYYCPYPTALKETAVSSRNWPAVLRASVVVVLSPWTHWLLALDVSYTCNLLLEHLSKE
ncbi:hypothetical protein BYT27DRAFT_6901817 [Phlegmacium glaucopus]|nr:hypothetical protein BYT27DRAFT_6901817 [Phlegmacium glaucopus]